MSNLDNDFDNSFSTIVAVREAEIAKSNDSFLTYPDLPQVIEEVKKIGGVHTSEGAVSYNQILPAIWEYSKGNVGYKIFRNGEEMNLQDRIVEITRESSKKTLGENKRLLEEQLKGLKDEETDVTLTFDNEGKISVPPKATDGGNVDVAMVAPEYYFTVRVSKRKDDGGYEVSALDFNTNRGRNEDDLRDGGMLRAQLVAFWSAKSVNKFESDVSVSDKDIAGESVFLT